MGYINARPEGGILVPLLNGTAEGTLSYGRGRSLDGGPAPDLSKSRLEDRVARAHRMFLSRTQEKLLRATEIASLIEEQGQAVDPAILAELHDIAHSVAGNSGSFGYQKLSETAERLEVAIDREDLRPHVIFDLVVSMAAEFLTTRTA